MRPTQLLALPFRYKPWRPRHLRLIMRDFRRTPPQPAREHREHLRAAIDWLCRAQDVRNGKADSGGVSAGWSFEDGWLPSYPETSGYIVETFLAAARVLDRSDLEDRARRIIDWELSIQLPDGAFPGHFGEPGSQPVIFNTGQIMHGMLAGFVQLGRTECLESAARAGHWLARHQDADGCWRRIRASRRAAHVQHTRNMGAAGNGTDDRRRAAQDRSDSQPRVGAGAAATDGMVRKQRLHAGAATVHAYDRLCDPGFSGVRRAAWQRTLS